MGSFSEQTHKVKILLVEDTGLIQLLMKTILEGFGFNVDIAANGKIAIDKLSTSQFDIILMDLQMPVMDGFEATEYIRHKLNLNLPIIALTSDVSTSMVEKCLSKGMQDYLSKPVDEKALHAAIVKYLKEAEHTNIEIKEEAIVTLIAPKKHINLDYLQKLTKNKPERMREMIGIYIQETSQLVKSMKSALEKKDWEWLKISAHSIIPFFSIAGMELKYEDMAKEIQAVMTDYLNSNSTEKLSEETINHLKELSFEIEQACTQACEELRAASLNEI